MKTIVRELHELFNSRKRYSFPFEGFKFEIPKNGIYLIFEKGERYEQFDRIVRVGTHNGRDQLYSRLKQHFIKENKNRSIFRKNIGRCFLNRDGNPYLSIWEFDTTSAAEKKKYAQFVDTAFEKQLERQITDYIQANLSFCVFRVDDKIQRLYWESKIASTLAQSADVVPSPSWLGNYSSEERIRSKGLWQVNGLGKEPLTEKQLDSLRDVTLG